MNFGLSPCFLLLGLPSGFLNNLVAAPGGFRRVRLTNAI
jgi:hypothetical protein